ncbi:MAG TPA: hypothetical protein VF832_06025, partial [Longimicrobiales bacterium]
MAASAAVATPALGASAGPGAPPRLSYGAAWGATAAALLAIVIWTRSLSLPYLALPVAALLAAIALAWWTRARSGAREWARPRAALLPLWGAMTAALVGIGFGVATTYELSLVGSRWEALVARREQRLTTQLDRRMSAVIRSGRDAVTDAATAAGAAGGQPPSLAVLFARLADVQQRTGVSAIVIIDSVGQPMAWAGDHRGRLPDGVRGNGFPIQYLESPLFSYLYYSAAVGNRGEHAVAAILLQTGLPMKDAPAVSFADRFAERLQARPLFAPGSAAGAAWTLSANGRPVVHASFQRLTQSEWRDGVATSGRRAALLAVVAGLLLLAWSWLRRRDGRQGASSGLPLVLLVAAAALAPLGDVLGIPRLFSPGLFMLPY